MGRLRLKLDENLPVGLVAPLQALGFEVDTVESEGLQGRPDTDVWRGAQEDGRVLLTQDLDFCDARKFAPGTHKGCIIFRLGNPARAALIRHVLSVMSMTESKTWSDCVVVATDLKVRVRR